MRTIKIGVFCLRKVAKNIFYILTRVTKISTKVVDNILSNILLTSKIMTFYKTLLKFHTSIIDMMCDFLGN